MKNMFVHVGICTICVLLVLSGCTSQVDIDKKKFLGTWTGTVYIISLNHTTYNWTLTFFANGTYNEGPRTGGLWSITDGQLSLRHPTQQLYVFYTFSENDTVLTLYSSAIRYDLTKQHSTFASP